MSGKIQIEVVYALADEQSVIALEVKPGTTVEQAIHRSGLAEKYPEIDLQRNRVGVYGRLVNLNDVVRDRDRVEIYRPLVADPQEARRRRVRVGKAGA